MVNEKLRLSVGASPGQRVFAVLVGLLFTSISAVFVLLPVVADGLLRGLTSPGEITYENVRDLPPELLPAELQDSPAGLGPFRLVGLCGVPFLLLGLYLMLRTVRTAVWLEGTHAQVRGALFTRTVDLATADVTAGAIALRGDHGPAGQLHRIPTIVARVPDRGWPVTIPLQGMGLATLPPHELRALADAMTAGRPTDGRNGDVHVLAGQLRAMAANPLGL